MEVKTITVASELSLSMAQVWVQTRAMRPAYGRGDTPGFYPNYCLLQFQWLIR